MLRATNRPVLAYFEAIKNLHLRQVAMILKAGYDPNLLINGRGQNGLQYMINYFGGTDAHFRLQAPLNMAAYLGIARLLLDSGLDANSVDLLSGETVIFDAIRFNDRDMVSLLLHYADFSVRNKNGESPLMCAARFGSKQVMRMVLEHLRHLEMDGYFLRQRNRFGLTPLELARSENLECAKVLTKHLITHGLTTNAVLARSSSHHQLRAYHQLGPSAVGHYAGADSASDYDDLCLPPAAVVTHKQHAARKLAPYYDPQAAQFSRYLLEQQDIVGGGGGGGGSEQRPGGSGGLGAAGQGLSDENSDEIEGRFYGPAGGSLIRSRSCILGGPGAAGSGGANKQRQEPAAGKYSSGAGQSHQLAAGKSKAGNEATKLGANYNWAPSQAPGLSN